jgi:mono/diheme cytochrome c family protein
MRKGPMIVALAAALSLPLAAHAQSFANPVHFQERDGAAIYQNVCQACHMSDGRGAAGAGAYPALARDGHVSEPGYPVTVVLKGEKGMPGFAAMLTDAQIAAVVTYVRTHFGNDFADPVTPADVAQVRGH